MKGLIRSFVMTLCVSALHAQEPKPAYDVVSIKPNDHSRGISISVDDNIYKAINTSLKDLAQDAYGIRRDLIYGAPAWAETARFDVQAKVLDADPHTLGKLTDRQRGALLKPILEERFHVKAHTEIRILPLYELVLAKGGPKFEETTAAGKKVRWNNTSAGGMSIHNGQLTAHDVTLASLIDVLAPQLRRAVIDKTGLTGHYDLQLNWARDEAAPSPDATAPSLTTALEEQLGLKLVASKGPVETLVVDHAELPAED